MANLGKGFYTYYNNYVELCKKISDKKIKDNCLYCLEETIYSMDFYKGAAELLKNENIVYDIGANSNVQRYFFEKNETKFIGIDSYPFFKCSYTEGMIVKEYPFAVKERNACAVSNLCLGYLIPLTEENIISLKQFKTIIFQYIDVKKYIGVLNKHFKVSKCLEDVEDNCIMLQRK